MVLRINRKGIFFSVFVIVVVTIFSISYASFNSFEDKKVERDRVETLNGHAFSVEKDLERKLRISGFRILFLFESKIIEDGSPLSNLDSGFSEAFFNGTIYGNTDTDIALVMSGATFSDILSSLQNSASKVNLDIDIKNPKISIDQIDPWNVRVNLDSNFVLKDKEKTVSWNKTGNITAMVPIEGFEDPLYLLSTGGLVSNQIKNTTFRPFASGSDLSNLSSHVSEGMYIESNEAPSFLMRLEGINSASGQGIESLVYLPRLSSQGITLKDKSVVDHVYFSSNDPPSSSVSGMPSWFKLDDPHKSDYGV